MSAADQVAELPVTELPAGNNDRGGEFGSHIVEIMINNSLTKGAGGSSDKKGQFTLHPVKEGKYLATGEVLVAPRVAPISSSVVGGKFDCQQDDTGTEGVVAYAIPSSSKMLVVYFNNPFKVNVKAHTVKIAILPIGHVDTALLEKMRHLWGHGLQEAETEFTVENLTYKLIVITAPAIKADAGTLFIPVTFSSDIAN